MLNTYNLWNRSKDISTSVYTQQYTFLHWHSGWNHSRNQSAIIHLRGSRTQDTRHRMESARRVPPHHTFIATAQAPPLWDYTVGMLAKCVVDAQCLHHKHRMQILQRLLLVIERFTLLCSNNPRRWQSKPRSVGNDDDTAASAQECMQWFYGLNHWRGGKE